MATFWLSEKFLSAKYFKKLSKSLNDSRQDVIWALPSLLNVTSIPFRHVRISVGAQSVRSYRPDQCCNDRWQIINWKSKITSWFRCKLNIGNYLNELSTITKYLWNNFETVIWLLNFLTVLFQSYSDNQIQAHKKHVLCKSKAMIYGQLLVRTFKLF